MCFLSYVPTVDGFILTSNRDVEATRVPALPPNNYMLDGNRWLGPKDIPSGGTWIGTCPSKAMVLLNGGFEKHTPRENYRISRGKIIPNYKKYLETKDFLNDFSLQDIEPFTLVIFYFNKLSAIEELVWDGENIHQFTKLVDQMSTWSSATLYNQEQKKYRNDFFMETLSAQTKSPEDIFGIHKIHDNSQPTVSLNVKKENGIITTCITQLCISNQIDRMRFEDLQQGVEKNYCVF